MVSAVSKAEVALLRTALAPVATWTFAPDRWTSRRSRTERIGSVVRAASGTRTASSALSGVPAELTTPRNGRKDLVVLYLHGGGWTVGSPKTHRGLCSQLASHLSAPVWAIDYRLAPEHPYPAALEDCMTAYGELVAQGHQRIIVAGDSAGGNLTLALALALRELGLPAPAALGMICPVVDMTSSAATNLRDNPREPILSAQVVRQMYDAYAGSHPREDPLLSPSLGELAGLPRVVLDSCADDILAEQALTLAHQLRANGVRVDHIEYQDRWHVFHLLAGLWPRATTAVSRFADRLSAAAQLNEARAR